jgi:hypothetical protein
MHDIAWLGYWLRDNLLDERNNRTPHFRVADTHVRGDQCKTVSSGNNTVQGGGFPIDLGHLGQAFEEKGHFNVKDFAQVLQTACADAVRTLFILLNLLECQPKRFCYFFLALIEHKTPHAQAGANMFVGRVDPVRDHRQVLQLDRCEHNHAGSNEQDKLSCRRLLGERFPSKVGDLNPHHACGV